MGGGGVEGLAPLLLWKASKSGPLSSANPRPGSGWARREAMGSEAKKEGMTYRHHSPLPRTTTGTAEAGSQGLQSESGRSPAETGRARRFEGSRLHACKVASSLYLRVR